MRIALLSDIHGNAVALDAVLADIESQGGVDGYWILGDHASIIDDELGVMSYTTDEELGKRFPDCQADLVVAGHTHEEADLTFNGIRYVTVGCIANSLTSDRRACYSILEASESGYQIIRRRIEFDYDRVIAGIKASHHPSQKWLLKFYERI